MCLCVCENDSSVTHKHVEISVVDVKLLTAGHCAASGCQAEGWWAGGVLTSFTHCLFGKYELLNVCICVCVCACFCMWQTGEVCVGVKEEGSGMVGGAYRLLH